MYDLNAGSLPTFKRINTRSSKLDYILLSKKLDTNFKLVDSNNASDHKILTAEIVFNE